MLTDDNMTKSIKNCYSRLAGETLTVQSFNEKIKFLVPQEVRYYYATSYINLMIINTGDVN